MARYTVNEAAASKARELIASRQYVLDSDWGDVQPGADAENAYLESHSWDEYGEWHLALTDGANDGTKEGFDLELLRAVRAAVAIPVIASGGAGRVEHFPPAVEAGADAVLAASVFHFGTLRVADVKKALEESGHAVR